MNKATRKIVIGLLAITGLNYCLGQTTTIENKSLVIDNIPLVKLEESPNEKLVIIVDSSVYSQKNIKKLHYTLNTRSEDALLKGLSQKKLDPLDKKNWVIIQIPDKTKLISVSNFDQIEGKGFDINELSIYNNSKSKVKLSEIKAEYFESQTNSNVTLEIKSCNFENCNMYTNKEMNK